MAKNYTLTKEQIDNLIQTICDTYDCRDRHQIALAVMHLTSYQFNEQNEDVWQYFVNRTYSLRQNAA